MQKSLFLCMVVIFQHSRYKTLWIILKKNNNNSEILFFSLSLRVYVKSAKVNQCASVMVVGGVAYVMKASAKVCISFDL